MSGKTGKTIFRILVGILSFCLLLVLIIALVAVFSRPKPTVPDTTDWQTGMVFFSVGDSWESVAVRSITGLRDVALSDSTPSHCGIVVMQENGPLLVHASTTAGHVVAETPAEYIEKNGSYCLYVKAPPLRLDTLKLRSDIDSLLRKPVPFDYDFDHSDSKSLYCTELVVTLHELNGCGAFTPLRQNKYIYPQEILDVLVK